MFKVPEKYRVLEGALCSEAQHGNNGLFRIGLSRPDEEEIQGFNIIASDGAGWEHLSISHQSRSRCPTWEEMAHIKDMFWEPEDCVVQFHPPESDYVNNHPFCLHLWRKIGAEFPRPPKILVGV